MRAQTLEIVWHKKEAIHALDILPFTEKNGHMRAATGGVDHMVRVWIIREECGKTIVEPRATLTRHERGVGAVRFCPVKKKGQVHLATSADDSIIIIWKLEEGRAPMQMIGEGDDEDVSKECWVTEFTLRGHIEDVNDLSWSADGSILGSSGIDHSIILWDADLGRKLTMCQNHVHYAQGVAVDPFGSLIASLSADRTLKFYTETKKKKERFKCVHTSVKYQFPGYSRPVRIWWDDSLPGFVRRLTWSPDGLLLACPSGEINPPPVNKEDKDDIKSENVKMETNVKLEPVDSKNEALPKRNCFCIFTRGNLRDPTLMIPTKEATMVTRWSPKLFKLRPDVQSNIFNLDYFMLFAVSTTDSVTIYETQQMQPVAKITDIHYANMTDMSWAPNGRSLFISSRDGYVTRIDITENELGKEYHLSRDQVLKNVREVLEKDSENFSDEETENQTPYDRLSPKLEKMALKGTQNAQKVPLKSFTPKSKMKKRLQVTTIPSNNEKPVEKKVKKKITLTTISSEPGSGPNIISPSSDQTL